MADPLPKSPKGHRLSRRSVLFFQQYIPDFLFHFPIAGQDYGWDIFVEVLLQNPDTDEEAEVYPINFFVQLKSITNITHKDNEVSRQLKVTTLRYLLGQSVPTLLVYYLPKGAIDGTETVFSEWLHNLVHDFDDIDHQKTLQITLGRHCEGVLDQETLAAQVLAYRGIDVRSQNQCPKTLQESIVFALWRRYSVVDTDTSHPKGAFSMRNSKGEYYYLHSKVVTLNHGNLQRIYYFSKKLNAAFSVREVPAGMKVSENVRTGLLLLKFA